MLPALLAIIFLCQPPAAAEPSFVVAEAAKLVPIATSDLGKDFLAGAKKATPFQPRTIYRKGRAREWLSEKEFAALTSEVQVAWQPMEVSEMMYQGLFYGSPTAYLLPVEHLGRAGGPTSLKGLKIADFGHGGIGQLRIFAEQGAKAVGVDVDPLQPLLYSHKGDQGEVGGEEGSIKIIHGKYPGDAKIVEQIGDGYDLFLSKNTLKRGYVHPEREADQRMLIDLGATDEQFVSAVARLLKPNGWFVIYNLAPAQNPADKPYLPMADGRSPFSRETLEKAGFEVIQFDANDDELVRRYGTLVDWDKPPTSMKLETELFAWVTICRKRR
jgi:SAM-dependent methyltransferase